jgi:hypothetical protein
LSQKKFTEVSDKELWDELRSKPVPMPQYLKDICKKHEEAYQASAERYSAIGSWCCKISRRCSHVKTKDGTRMKINYCPSCGKKIEGRED